MVAVIISAGVYFMVFYILKHNIFTSYISPDMVQSDTNGSYTGMTADTFYNGEYEDPVQDADDL